jgi:hypothetical protein
MGTNGGSVAMDSASISYSSNALGEFNTELLKILGMRSCVRKYSIAKMFNSRAK